jgi:hypothetical protein
LVVVAITPNRTLSLLSINMKTARFLLVMAGFGALTLGRSFAGEPSGQSAGSRPSENHTAIDRAAGQGLGNPTRGKGDETDGKRSEFQGDGHVSKKSSQAGLTQKATPTHRPSQDRPGQAANSRQDPGERRVGNARTQRPEVNDLHQPGSKKGVTAAGDGLMMHTTATHRPQLAKLPVGSGTTAPLSGVVRSQGAAAARIGGAASSSAKNSAAAINGTGMGHKP